MHCLASSVVVVGVEDRPPFGDLGCALRHRPTLVLRSHTGVAPWLPHKQSRPKKRPVTAAELVWLLMGGGVDRARDLIIHGPAHRGANGAAMPTDEDDQDGNFFFSHPERGGYLAA